MYYIDGHEIGQDVLGTGDDDDTPTGQFCRSPRSINWTADEPLYFFAHIFSTISSIKLL